MPQIKTKPEAEDRGISLLEYLVVFLSRKRLILAGTVGSTLVALLICLILTPAYESVSCLMPPQSSSTDTLSQIMAQAGLAMGITGVSADTGSDLLCGLLQTEAIIDPVIEAFDMKKAYNVETLDAARRKFLKDTLDVESDMKSHIVSVTVADPDPQKAADMANACVQQLKNLLTRISITDAGKRRIFFEDQLRQSHDALKNSEEALQGFRESTGAIKMDDQASAILQTIVNLRTLVLSKESQLNVMKCYATVNNPDLKRAVEELRTLKDELKRLEQSTDKSNSDVVIPTAQIPGLGKEYVRKIRDFKFNEMLYEIIVKQYESARLDEARESLMVQVINEAKPSAKPARPMTLLICIIVAGSAFFLFVFLAFLMNFLGRISREESADSKRLQKIKELLRRF